MFGLESYAAVRRFVFVEGHSRREAAKVFALKGFTVAFTTAASLVNQLMEARDERRLLKLQREALPLAVVTDAVTQAVQLGAIGFDAVKLIALARIGRTSHLLHKVIHSHRALRRCRQSAGRIIPLRKDAPSFPCSASVKHQTFAGRHARNGSCPQSPNHSQWC